MYSRCQLRLITSATAYSGSNILTRVCLSVGLLAAQLNIYWWIFTKFGDTIWYHTKRVAVDYVWSREQRFKCWKWAAETYSGYQSVISAATLRRLDFAWNGAHCVRLWLYWQNALTSHTCTHLVLAGNDTVPISMRRGWEYLLYAVTSSSIYFHRLVLHVWSNLHHLYVLHVHITST